MFDDGEDFDDGDGGGEGPCGKMIGGCIGLLIGLIGFPASLYVLGWNEQNFVCEQAAIMHFDDAAEVLTCGTNLSAQAANGKFAYFSCPVDAASLRTFTIDDFNEQIESSDPLKKAASFASMTAVQETSMYQCVQEVRDEGGSRRRKKVYTYREEWRHSKQADTFIPSIVDGVNLITQGCPTWQGQQPAWPANLNELDETLYSNEVSAGGFRILRKDSIETQWGTSAFKATMPVNMGLFAQNFGTWTQPPNPPAGIGLIATGRVTTTPTGLATCTSPQLGCVSIKYLISDDTYAHVSASIVSGGATSDEETPKSWGCGTGLWARLRSSKAAVTKEDFVEMLHGENKASTWIIRIGGCILAWISVFCCFAPCLAGVDIFGDMLSCIPCCGDAMESIVEGAATFFVCIISCGFGFSASLLVIGITWVAMRPIYGIPMMIVACLCMCAGCVGFHQAAGARSAKKAYMSYAE